MPIVTHGGGITIVLGITLKIIGNEEYVDILKNIAFSAGEVSLADLFKVLLICYGISRREEWNTATTEWITVLGILAVSLPRNWPQLILIRKINNQNVQNLRSCDSGQRKTYRRKNYELNNMRNELLWNVCQSICNPSTTKLTYSLILIFDSLQFDLRSWYIWFVVWFYYKTIPIFYPPLIHDVFKTVYIFLSNITVIGFLNKLYIMQRCVDFSFS